MPEVALPSEVLRLLAEGRLEVVGRLAEASNAAFLAHVSAGSRTLLAIYKPVAGERPLWDFPDGNLAQRETAAFALSTAGGWDIVPETVLREGPHGWGSVQRWVGDPNAVPELVVDVVAPDRVPSGWLPVLRGQGPGGEPVLVVHEDSPSVAAVAAFDAVINNADRKGYHLVREDGEVRGFDHGVSFHAEDKLRTVLWGWAGEALPPEEVRRLGRLKALLEAPDSVVAASLAELLTATEVRALSARLDRLLEHPAYPQPGSDWPAIPWPPL